MVANAYPQGQNQFEALGYDFTFRTHMQPVQNQTVAQESVSGSGLGANTDSVNEKSVRKRERERMMNSE